LEVPSETTDNQIAAKMGNNLEAEAVKLFQRNHHIELVPVDLPTPEKVFFENYEDLHKNVEEKSRKYREITDSYSARLRRHGFYYLNSEYCSKDLAAINEEIDEYLKTAEDESLYVPNNSWIKQISMRDAEMCRNITNYCTEHTFERAVFLVGAAHRKGVMEETSKYELEWNFDGKGYWYPQSNT